MKRSLLFTLLTAAVAGRFLLPLKYIEHSVMLREFAPVSFPSFNSPLMGIPCCS